MANIELVTHVENVSWVADEVGDKYVTAISPVGKTWAGVFIILVLDPVDDTILNRVNNAWDILDNGKSLVVRIIREEPPIGDSEDPVDIPALELKLVIKASAVSDVE